MSRRWAGVGGIGLGILCVLLGRPAYTFIESPLPLKELIQDADHIFVAKVEKLDPGRPSMVLAAERDLKDKTSFRRMPVNLTGDKEKHTPKLLKRVAQDLPIVIFVLLKEKPDEPHVGLGYTNGTWFQVLGHKDGGQVRWAFTHCEIYLRRTYKGTTAELIQVLADAVSGKKPPPDLDTSEPPGFGPELEPKKKEAGGSGGGGALFGVIALPFLMPVAALLQLLFPGLLRDQWRQYKIAVYILLTQSTLLLVHMALVNWVVSERVWWLGDNTLWAALVAVAFLGAVWALVKRPAMQAADGRQPTADCRPGRPARPGRPVRVEYVAFGLLAFAGLGWASYLLWTSQSPIDQMSVVTLASLAGIVHLVFRRVRASALGDRLGDRLAARRPLVSTEVVFLWGLVLAGVGLGLYLNAPGEANADAGDVAAEWPTFRGNDQRTGAASADDLGDDLGDHVGISKPGILWTFDARERKGRVRLDSSPTVVDGLVYVGALHKALSLTQGRVYCINAADGRVVNEQSLSSGQRLWDFSAAGSLKPVFSSPTIAQGRLYFGEGYHQDSACRLFCLDARSGNRALWAKKTASHVESGPSVVGNRVYFGAGDDGILCVDADDLEAGSDGLPSPKTLWHVAGLHVDSCPLVTGGRLFVGTVLGDLHRELRLVAVNATSGQLVWKLPVPMPAAAAPAHANGRVFFALGAGKVNEDAANSQGLILCLDANADSPKRLWEYAADSAVLATPALAGESLFFCSRKGQVGALRQSDGQVQWKKQLDAGVVASPVVAGNRLYLLTTSGILYCLDVGNGETHWRFDELKPHADDDVYSSPTLAQGRLYVAVGSKLFCIGEKRGE